MPTSSTGWTSVYHWDGDIEQASEAVLILKTQSDQVEALIERVKTLHSYSCPCVVSWPIDRGNADYLDWIENKVRGG